MADPALKSAYEKPVPFEGDLVAKLDAKLTKDLELPLQEDERERAHQADLRRQEEMQQSRALAEAEARARAAREDRAASGTPPAVVLFAGVGIGVLLSAILHGEVPM
jgi:hypothetical protein